MNHYTIKLYGGKYTVINRNGTMEFLRNGEAWECSEERFQCGFVLAMAQRIEELETAIGSALYGSLDARGNRRQDGMTEYCGHQMIGAWEHDLRKALEQKEK